MGTLVEFGADYRRTVDNSDGDIDSSVGSSSVLHLCMAPSAPTGGGKVVKVILDSLERDKSNPEDTVTFLNQQSTTGDTVLHLASERHDLDTIQVLLRSGARSDVVDAQGYLPVQRLFKTEESRDCLTALLSAGPSGSVEGEKGELGLESGLPKTIRINALVEDEEGGIEGGQNGDDDSNDIDGGEEPP